MPPMQPTLLQGIQYIISCNSLLVEGGGNKYKVAGYTLYLAKLVANPIIYSLPFTIINLILTILAKICLAIFNRFRMKTVWFITSKLFPKPYNAGNENVMCKFVCFSKLIFTIWQIYLLTGYMSNLSRDINFSCSGLQKRILNLFVNLYCFTRGR